MRHFISGLLFAMAALLSPTIAGGGCKDYTVSGFQVGVCISNMNGMAIPDIYVNQAGDTANCHIDIETWDNHALKYGSTTVDCSKGHKIALPVGPFSKDMTLHSFGNLWIGGTAYAVGDSPPVSVEKKRSLSYHYEYVLVYPPTPSPEQVLRMATHDFQHLFPFHNCGDVLSIGQTCKLGGSNPIEVMALGSTSFTFLSLPGHAEGAGRVITFSFTVNSMTKRLFLNVLSVGPWSLAAEATRDIGIARDLWQGYADNLEAAILEGRAKNY